MAESTPHIVPGPYVFETVQIAGVTPQGQLSADASRKRLANCRKLAADLVGHVRQWLPLSNGPTIDRRRQVNHLTIRQRIVAYRMVDKIYGWLGAHRYIFRAGDPLAFNLAVDTVPQCVYLPEPVRSATESLAFAMIALNAWRLRGSGDEIEPVPAEAIELLEVAIADLAIPETPEMANSDPVDSRYCKWLGDGKIRIDDSTVVVVSGNQKTITESFLRLKGLASTAEQLEETSGINDAAREFREMRKKRAELAPYMDSPGRKSTGKGYSFRIIDATKPRK